MRVHDPADPDDTNAVYYPLTDHLGSTSVTAYEDGTYYSELRYKPWGEERYANGVMPTDLTYTGQRSNTDDFGLMYYVARFYDPALGRFVSADTVVQNPFSPPSFDRFSYTANNPIRYTDPSGHNHTCTSKCAAFYPVVDDQLRLTGKVNDLIASLTTLQMEIDGGQKGFELAIGIISAGVGAWFGVSSCLPTIIGVIPCAVGGAMVGEGLGGVAILAIEKDQERQMDKIQDVIDKLNLLIDFIYWVHNSSNQPGTLFIILDLAANLFAACGGPAGTGFDAFQCVRIDISDEVVREFVLNWIDDTFGDITLYDDIDWLEDYMADMEDYPGEDPISNMQNHPRGGRNGSTKLM